MASIDVIIPNYQYGHFLAECIESVQAQSHQDMRILIIDNASTDDSVAIARRKAAEDRRIEIVARETNQGPQASFNEGIDRARADYMMFLCSDDLLPPHAVARALAILEAHPRAVFAVGEEEQILIEGTKVDLGSNPATRAASDHWDVVSGPAFIESECEIPSRPVSLGSIIVRTALQKQAGYFRPALSLTDDLEMALRLAMLGDVATTQGQQCIRRLHDRNLSHDSWARGLRSLQEFLDALDSFFTHEGRSLVEAGRLQRLYKWRTAERAYWGAVSEALAGRFGNSRVLITMAARLYPQMLVAPPIGYILRMPNPTRRVAAAVSKYWRAAA